MRLNLWCGLTAAALLSACFFDDAVPSGIHVSCSSSRECPADQACRVALGECRPVDDVEDDPIAVVDTGVGPDEAPQGEILAASFSTSRAAARLPEVFLDTGEPFVVAEGSDNAFTAARSVDGAETEGLHRVLAHVVDEDGNEATAILGTVTLDFTAPTLDLERSSISPPTARPGDTVAVTVLVSEPITATLTLRVGDGALVTTVDIDGAIGVATFPAPAGDGVLSVVVEDIVDAAGNAAAPITLTDTLTIDGTPPALTLDALSRSRFSAQPGFSSVVVTGAADNDATITATLGVEPMACSLANGGLQCSTGLLGSEPEGPTAITVVARDPAGNEASDTVVVTVDNTPPRPVAGSLTAAYRAAPGSLVPNPVGLPIGGSAVVTFALSEAPTGDVIATVPGLVTASVVAAGPFVSFSLTGDEDATVGAVEVSVTTHDDVGNAATTVAGTVQAMLSRPAPPQTFGPNVVTVDADLRSEGGIVPRLVVPPGTIPEGSLLVARGPGDRLLALLEPADVERRVNMTKVDKPVRMFFVDAAGNLSAQAIPDVVAIIGPAFVPATFCCGTVSAPIDWFSSPAFGSVPEQNDGRTFFVSLTRDQPPPPPSFDIVNELPAPPGSVFGLAAVTDVPSGRIVWLDGTAPVNAFGSTGADWVTLDVLPLLADGLVAGQSAGGAAMAMGFDDTSTPRALVLNGSSWTDVPVVDGRRGGCLARDAAGSRTFLASPLFGDGTPSRELWAFDGVTWSIVDSNAPASTSCVAAMTPDGLHVVGNDLNDFRFDGAGWTFVAGSNLPMSSLAYDSVQGRLVGASVLGITLAELGGGWDFVGVELSPPPGGFFVADVNGKPRLVGVDQRLAPAAQMIIRAKLLANGGQVLIPRPTQVGVSFDINAARSGGDPLIQVRGARSFSPLLEQTLPSPTHLIIADTVPLSDFEVENNNLEVVFLAPEADATSLAVGGLELRLRDVGFFYF